MGKKKQRIDVNPIPSSLTDNPFAALADQLPKDLPKQGTLQEDPTPRAEILTPQKLPYSVERTRKGGYDIAFERRAKGKGVTILRRVHGDSEALLSALKKKCGAGGTSHEDRIELQGDHRVAIEHTLRGLGL